MIKWTKINKESKCRRPNKNSEPELIKQNSQALL